MFRGIFLLDVLQCVFRCRSPFVVLLTPRAWNVETGHDDVLSLRELSATPALWRAARRRRLGMKGTGLDERIEPEAGKEVSDADKSLPDRNGQ